jgi:hypothetical protein
MRKNRKRQSPGLKGGRPDVGFVLKLFFFIMVEMWLQPVKFFAFASGRAGLKKPDSPALPGLRRE